MRHATIHRALLAPNRHRRGHECDHTRADPRGDDPCLQREPCAGRLDGCQRRLPGRSPPGLLCDPSRQRRLCGWNRAAATPGRNGCRAFESDHAAVAGVERAGAQPRASPGGRQHRRCNQPLVGCEMEHVLQRRGYSDCKPASVGADGSFMLDVPLEYVLQATPATPQVSGATELAPTWFPDATERSDARPAGLEGRGESLRR